jgi:hypothetical protein
MIALQENITVSALANLLNEFHKELDQKPVLPNYTGKIKNLLSKGDSNAKTEKNELETFILYMAPAKSNSYGVNLCPKASKGCVFSCLVSSGRMAFTTNYLARIRKADFYVNPETRKEFCLQLWKELSNKNKTAKKRGYKVAVRLNGTTDLDFFGILKNQIGKDLLALDNLVYYDYTKLIGKVLKYQNAIKEGKYFLTFSRSENNWNECLQALAMGVNVAVVFDKKKPLPSTFEGYQVIDGDVSDIEMISNSGVILGLKAKGKALKDQTGFVIR